MNRHFPFIILFAVLLSLCPRALAAAGDAPVRVGVYDNGAFMSRDASGQYVGFCMEYLQHLFSLAGRQFVRVESGSWANALAMLERGELDVLPSVYRTPQMEKRVLFPRLPMCTLYMTLMVRQDDERYGYEDHRAFQGMRVGVLRGSRDSELFANYCAGHGIAPVVAAYDDISSLLHDLEAGTLDGVALTHPGRRNTFRCVARFAPEPVYMAVSARHPDLLASLDAAMDNSVMEDPSYGIRLFRKYFAASIAQKPVFTRAEQAFLERSPVVDAVYDPTWAPLEYTDPETGEFAGVTADMLAEIASLSGLSFRFRPVSQQEALRQIREGRTDVVCSVTGDYLWNDRNNMNSTRYYLSMPTALVRRTQGPIRRIALQDGFWISEKIAEDNADRVIERFRSVRECLDALRYGRVDAVYANIYVVNHLLSEREYAGLHVVPLSQYTMEMSIGVSRSADRNLLSILDKCVRYTAAETLDGLVIGNTMKPRQVSFREFMRDHALEFGAAALFVGGVIVILLLRNMVTRNFSAREIAALRYKDPLTGLDNMNGFTLACEKALSVPGRPGYVFLYGDIFQFKLINANIGFAAGDELLRAYARILERSLRPGELCGRVSAAQFVLLLRFSSPDEPARRLAEIADRLDEWRRAQEFPYRIETTFGACFVGRDDRDVHRIFDFANHARRSAKRTPGRSLVFYDEGMRLEALREQELAGRLETALEQGEFEIWYQPKVDMRTGGITGAEALVRWNHPLRGLLGPGAFVPLFERSGAIVEVDLHVYRQVCLAQREWMERGLPSVLVSCNFSSIHFESDAFSERLAAVAGECGVPSSRLELEITESALMRNPGRVASQIVRLRDLGFKVAIDDFGAGYSSLGQLQQMMADVLKLDRSFVRRGQLGPREQVVIASVIRMAEQLGMEVICEGVETAEQAEMLIRLGCWNAQGFLYARPMPRERFEAVLAAGSVRQVFSGGMSPPGHP